MIISPSLISFKPLKESHFPLLLKWLQTPHVRAWWDADIAWTPDLIKQKYQDCVLGFRCVDPVNPTLMKPMHALIIYHEERPAGYIQYYNLHHFPREGNPDFRGFPASTAALDFYLGEAECLGKGLGAKALSQFQEEHIFREYGACFVDPDIHNKAAIRCYEKAGFRKTEMQPDHTVLWMLNQKAENYHSPG